jgi:phosphoglycolate phosphatase-like HAD superfamily hydrolase
LRALVFDVGGTLADTERFHLRAFARPAEEGLPWHWVEAPIPSCWVSGGKERMLAWWRHLRRMVGCRRQRLAPGGAPAPGRTAHYGRW